MDVSICPLCGLGSHPGKCERPSRGIWFCGLCLLEKLPAAPALPTSSAVPSSGAPPPPETQVPPAILLASGVQRTKRWCKRCGVPLCALHTKVDHCPEECRRRLPAVVERLNELVERYSPEFLTDGPGGCAVCGAPPYRRDLCTRHYRQMKSGRTTQIGRAHV